MLSIERIAGFGVVETLRGWFPMNHLEVDAVVVGMAFNARSSGSASARECGMETCVSPDFAGDFGVAFEATKCG